MTDKKSQRVTIRLTSGFTVKVILFVSSISFKRKLCEWVVCLFHHPEWNEGYVVGYVIDLGSLPQSILMAESRFLVSEWPRSYKIQQFASECAAPALKVLKPVWPSDSWSIIFDTQIELCAVLLIGSAVCVLENTPQPCRERKAGRVDAGDAKYMFVFTLRGWTYPRDSTLLTLSKHFPHLFDYQPCVWHDSNVFHPNFIRKQHRRLDLG